MFVERSRWVEGKVNFGRVYDPLSKGILWFREANREARVRWPCPTLGLFRLSHWFSGTHFPAYPRV